MKLTAKLCTILLLFLACQSFAGTNSWFTTFKQRVLLSTNQFYAAKEMTYEITPTISAPSFLGKPNYTIGMSMEYEYWQTPSMGTGMEIGTYDYKHFVDHISVMEDYRIVPFISPIWNRVALEGKIATEHFFVDNSHDIGFGLGVDFAFTRRIRGEFDFMQHYRLDSSKNGATLRVGLQWVF